MEGTPLLEWLCEQLHTTDKEVRQRPYALSSAGGGDGGESFLTRLAERQMMRISVMRKAAASS